MKNKRGNHTTLIPLAEEVIKILSKNFKNFEFSPGLIVRKNIKIKEVSIILQNEITSILMTTLMKGAKQFVRLYNINISELESSLTKFCKEKQIHLKIK